MLFPLMLAAELLASTGIWKLSIEGAEPYLQSLLESTHGRFENVPSEVLYDDVSPG
jgi:hypothetical protein